MKGTYRVISLEDITVSQYFPAMSFLKAKTWNLAFLPIFRESDLVMSQPVCLLKAVMRVFTYSITRIQAYY